jgi:hypothetical protein
MGARINYVFKDEDPHPSVVLYSHWGETEWQRDLAMALQHSKPRWADIAYGTRMMISYLMQDSVLEEIGFGIYAVVGPNYDLGEFTVVVDMTNQTIYEVGSNVQVQWEDFVQAYNPKVYAEASAAEGSPSA